MKKPESLLQTNGVVPQNERRVLDPAQIEKERRHTKGILWILLPIISLPFVLFAYAVARFIGSQLVQATPVVGDLGLRSASPSVVFFQSINVALTLIPLVAIPVGLIVGLSYLLKK